MLLLFVAAASSEVIQYMQKLDHNDPMCNLTFSQKVVCEYDSLKNFTRVVIYLPGWSSIPAGSDPFPSSVREIATETEATLVAIEPRFFGNSMPEDFDLSSENLMKYVSVEQVLADIALIIVELQCKHTIVVGGGDAGFLAAWMRIKYPHLVHAAWSSSGPIQYEQFPTDTDNMLIQRIRKAPNGDKCATRARELMLDVHDVMTAGGEEDRKILRTLFNVSESVSDLSFIFEVSTLFMSMATSEGTHQKLLNTFCFSQTTMADLAYMFRSCIHNFGLTTETFDPFALDVNTSTVEAINRLRVMWFLRCRETGGFHVYNASSPLRSPWINKTFYNGVCETLFGVPALDNSEWMITYGGLNQAGSSVIFTYSTWDYQSQREAINPDSSNEVYAGVIQDGDSYSTDLDVENPEDSDDLKAVRKWAVATMIDWMTFREDRCEHGTQILNRCLCEKNWGGDYCEVAVVETTKLIIASSTMTLVPTFVILIAAIAAWLMVVNNDDLVNPRKIVF